MWVKSVVCFHVVTSLSPSFSFQRGDLFRPHTPASYVPPFWSYSGPPQNYPRHGYPAQPRSNSGTPLSSRDYNDPRRQSYDRNRASQYNSGGYQGNRSHYNSGGYQGNQPTAWSHQGPGSSQSQYSRSSYQHSSRDHRHQPNQQRGPPARVSTMINIQFLLRVLTHCQAVRWYYLDVLLNYSDQHSISSSNISTRTQNSPVKPRGRYQMNFCRESKP